MRFNSIAIMAAIAICTLSGNLRGEDTTLEYQVKAAFLFNFAKFVEWPSNAFESTEAPIVLGVLGDNPFGSSLRDIIDGKTVNNRRLLIRRFESAEEARKAHILFISASERNRLPNIMNTLKESHVLTVGEGADFLNTGGIIRFVLEEGKVRFEINLESAERAALKISSKLLKLARFVKGGPR